MVLDAIQRWDADMTAERLFAWHRMLFPDGRNNVGPVQVGQWRTSPMKVVSGPIGRERVHFEAPAAERVPAEMNTFLSWFAKPANIDPVVRAGMAHFWFETIHPFDDGNGRMGRAIMDMALTQADGSQQRYYSVSRAILAQRRGYYEVLEHCQRGDLDITPWLVWFLEILEQSLSDAEVQVERARRRQTVLTRNLGLNLRQIKAIERMIEGFEGKMRTAKYAALTNCSDDTALRDLTDLVDRGVLTRLGAGRGSHYVLADAYFDGVVGLPSRTE